MSASLDALSDGDRAVLELVTQDGLTVTEAAAVLGIRAGTARARLHRARRAMQAAVPRRTDFPPVRAGVPEAIR